MIGVIDYGMGNLRSVVKGFEKCGYFAKVVNDPGEARECSALVVPGVGAFRDAMKNICKYGMDKIILEAVENNKPLMGICLGFQVLFSTSEEHGNTEGLGIFPGKVQRLPASLKVPHMGWNQVQFTSDCVLFNNIPEYSAFYFVHSYFVTPDTDDIIVTRTDYGINFVSGVTKNNIFGIQFHPEKSSALGLRILRNFGGLVVKC
ncbi:MAG: imidazole glycerol phosphate synthase subunit HisH [Clostridiales bacterium]|nr:imidazole glycerol phosphate synthase subunit HisH [Clostridiales bacterium]MCF8021677.1 imidazole glycerol phosphate synthase subunit HisH [Clostridiales bacterium]